MTNGRLTRGRGAFSLIEMIGVLAVISILAAIVAPKIFDTIQDAKATRISSEMQTYASAVAKWYKDIGSLQHLNATGVAQNTNDAAFNLDLQRDESAGAGTGLWARWKGPYLDSLGNPSVGSAMVIHNYAAANGGAVAANNSTTVDLNGDGTNDLVTGNRVVFLYVTGVGQNEFTKVDGILDQGVGAGGNEGSYGRVKYDPATAGGAMRLYLAHN